MSSRHAPRSTSIALVATAALACVAWLGPRALASPAASAPTNDAIEQAMGEMNAAVKALSKGITAENRTTALEDLARFQKALLGAKVETPDKAAGVEEKKRADYVAEFRKTLAEALKLSCDAEIAVLDGKYKDADAVIKNKLMALKSAGHGKFKQDKEGK